jgi:hypothetical protein
LTLLINTLSDVAHDIICPESFSRPDFGSASFDLVSRLHYLSSVDLHRMGTKLAQGSGVDFATDGVDPSALPKINLVHVLLRNSAVDQELVLRKMEFV